MDAAQALADLTEISSQVESAVLVDEGGAVAASTLADEERARRIAAGAKNLLDQAAQVREGADGTPTQLEAATVDGSVFVVRDGGRLIAATTGAEPTVGLVFYDLKSCLRRLASAAAEEKPKPRRRKKADAAT